MLGVMPQGTMMSPEPAAEPMAMPVPSVGNTSSGTVEVSFAPTVNISGQADASIAEMIRAALAEQKKQFEKDLPDMLRRARANERRLSYV